MAGSYDGKSTALGGGGRFAEIADKAATQYGSAQAGRRVAAAIERQKYGEKKTTQLAERGEKRAQKDD